MTRILWLLLLLQPASAFSPNARAEPSPSAPLRDAAVAEALAADLPALAAWLEAHGP